MSAKLRWGILSTGRIAGTFAEAVGRSATGVLVAVASRNLDKAEAFGQKYGIPKRYGSYEELLAVADVDAVYIATPHPMHAEWAVKAAEAGKHILCEKPLALNHADAMRMIAAARDNDVFLMEAFMYRCSPQTARLAELVREKAIGEVKLIQASFGFRATFNEDSRLFSNAFGGGGILDVGCYPVSMSRLLAGAAVGKDFADPVEVKGVGRLGRTGVDEAAAAALKFPSGILAEVSTGVDVTLENVVRVFGTEGVLFVPSPWVHSRAGEESRIIVTRYGEAPREIVIKPEAPLYALEADTVAANIARRQAPAMSWADSLGNMRALDAWREAIGLVYDSEKPEAEAPAVHRRPLAVRPNAPMTYGTVPGVNKKVSRLIMGVDNQRTQPHADAMFDDFFEQGGTVFDTAYIYVGGEAEGTLGRWVRKRGLREQVVILDKGAHTPFCDPASLTRQFLTSLERLQTDYVDLYMMHRDNLDVPVEEFLDVLSMHQRAGRMRLYGASNWTLPRIEEFNASAAAKGVPGFAAISNNFSLASMFNAPWTGCLTATDPAFREWFGRTQTPLMPWSSQARGFFVRGDPTFRQDAELVNCWYTEDNFRRLARARELAQKMGAEPVQIALAYVLNQPFPTFPLIGPRTISETRSSLAALRIQLAPEHLRWLNLED